MTKTPRRNTTYTLILAVILLFVGGGCLRGTGLWQRGLMAHDEGHALLNANTWHQILRWALSGGLWGENSVAQLRDELHRQGGTLYSAGKFGYSLLLAVVALPGHVTTGEALWLAWVAGLLVCGLAGLLTWQYSRSLFGSLLAVAGTVLSPLLGDLSREASGVIWSLMFGLGGACLLHAAGVVGSRRWLWFGLLGGAMLGYGFTCHFNLAPFILAVFLVSGITMSREKSGWSRVGLFFKSLLPAAVASLAVLLMFELATRVVDYRLRDVYPDYLPFSGELHRLFFRDQEPMLHGVLLGDGAIGWGASAWAVYGMAAWHEGLPWMTLTVTSVLVLLRRRWPISFASEVKLHFPIQPLILFFVPLIFWLGYVYKVERVLGMCVAASWVAIGAAYGPLVEQKQWRGKRRWLVTLLILFPLAYFSVSESRRISRSKHSPVPGIVHTTLHYAKNHGGIINAGSFDTGYAPIWKWSIVQQMRGDEFAGIRSHVDFATFQDPDIVFLDPSTWHGTSARDFSVEKNRAMESRVIAIFDKGTFESRDLRFKATTREPRNR